MGITTNKIYVGATRVKIVQGAMSPVRVVLTNYEHAEAKKLYVGGPDVTAETGLEINGYPFDITLSTGNDLFAIADENQSVYVGVFRMDF